MSNIPPRFRVLIEVRLNIRQTHEWHLLSADCHQPAKIELAGESLCRLLSSASGCTIEVR